MVFPAHQNQSFQSVSFLRKGLAEKKDHLGNLFER
jgi:hypothetical protein